MLITSPDHSRHRCAAVGMFDGVHLGHRHLIGRLGAAALARGLTTTAVTFRRHPRSVLTGHPQPMLTDVDRRAALLAEAGVDDVIVLDFDRSLADTTARDFMVMLHRDYLVDTLLMGFNNRFGHDRRLVPADYVDIGRQCGVEVLLADEFIADGHAGVSSSVVRRLLLDRDPAQAALLLGRRYSITGRVVHGRRLGRTIGFPTANIEPINPDALVPGGGVYAALAVTPDGVRRPSILNIGHRPTVDAPDAPVSIEVHILDFDGYIYGSMLTIEFVDFLRAEQRFPSLDALKAQLALDSAEARRLIAAL